MRHTRYLVKSTSFHKLCVSERTIAETVVGSRGEMSCAYSEHVLLHFLEKQTHRKFDNCVNLTIYFSTDDPMVTELMSSKPSQSHNICDVSLTNSVSSYLFPPGFIQKWVRDFLMREDPSSIPEPLHISPKASTKFKLIH